MIIRETKIHEILRESDVSISCDSCKEIFVFRNERSVTHIANFVCIEKTFEYGSKKDGDTYSAHLCESCADKILGPYWHKENIKYR